MIAIQAGNGNARRSAPDRDGLRRFAVLPIRAPSAHRPMPPRRGTTGG